MSDSDREERKSPEESDDPQEAVDIPGSSRPAAAPEASGAGAGQRRVLVVDDEDLIRFSLTRTMAQRGAEVLGCATAEDALQAAARRFFHLCFLDLRLPGMDGLEALGEFRRISPRTRIAIMTASHLDNRERGHIERYADFFLPKPFELFQVRSIAEEVLGFTRPPQES